MIAPTKPVIAWGYLLEQEPPRKLHAVVAISAIGDVSTACAGRWSGSDAQELRHVAADAWVRPALAQTSGAPPHDGLCLACVDYVLARLVRIASEPGPLEWVDVRARFDVAHEDVRAAFDVGGEA